MTERKRQISGDAVIANEAKQSLHFLCLNEIASASANWQPPRNNSQINNQ